MTGYRLGDQEFLSMDSVVPYAQKQISMQVRPGSNHATFFDLGTVADPVQIETVVDVLSKETAIARMRSYDRMVGTVVDVEWAGVELSSLQVMIMGVRPAQGRGSSGISRILLGVGGTEQDPEALVRVIWTVCGVEEV